MIDKKLKEQIRLHYETHMQSPKEISKIFNVGYRTIFNWIKKENWEQGKGLKNAVNTEAKKLLKGEFGSVLHLNKEKIKENIKSNLNPKNYENLTNLDDIIEGLSDEILFKMLNVEFLHKNMMKSFLIAQEELIRMRFLRKENQINPAIISSAEKCVNILANIQKNLYDDKILSQALNSQAEIDLQKTSTAELIKLINDATDEEN